MTLTDEDRALIARLVKPYTAMHAMVVNHPEEVAALLSAARTQSQGEGWEPIETAKRDGRHYLACNNPPTMPYGPTWGFNQRPPVVVHWFDDPNEPGWYPSYGAGDEPPMQLTHVLELPAPPASQIKG